MNKKRTEKTECSMCKNSRPIPGDAHISCVKPDFTITANRHGVMNRWFQYPINYDPVWKTNFCRNFEDKNDLV